MSAGRVIFYHPVPIDRNAASASGVRPLRLLTALEDAGYRVDTVIGYSHERSEQFKEIRKNVRNGVRYRFAYGESSTMPTELTDPGHFPKKPFLDYRFLRFCKKAEIPFGLFYRDIYWRFPDYRSKVPWYKRFFAVLFYRFDLLQYRKFLKLLFLPSLRMAEYIPGDADRVEYRALHPGHNVTKIPRKDKETFRRLLYVGGVGDHYNLKCLIEAIADHPKWHLTICTRKKEWDMNKHDMLAGQHIPNLSIEHSSGPDVIPLFQTHGIGIMFVEPVPYWDFAVPYKMYEYLGYGMPIVATKKTHAGDIVEALGIGWSLEYSTASFGELLNRLETNFDNIEDKKRKIESIHQYHTWDMRVSDIDKYLYDKE